MDDIKTSLNVDPEKLEEISKKVEHAYKTLGIVGKKMMVPISVGSQALRAAAQLEGDIHKFTLEHDDEFLAFARALFPNFDDLPFEERRMHAKRWNFGKLYRGGIDVLKNEMRLEELIVAHESELGKKQRLFDLAWARMKARRDGK